MTREQITQAINNFEPPVISDFPKIPYKTIMITLLLFFSSILFITVGIHKYQTDHTWDVYVSYLLLGILLFIPGAYFTFMLMNILLRRPGYDYSDLPDLSDQ